MSAHLLWVEAQNLLPEPGVAQVYCFFGHPTQPANMFAPLMDRVYLLTPRGAPQILELRKGRWNPGYGYAEHWVAEAVFGEEGIYKLVARRSPGVYDLGWHGGESAPFLSYNFAQTWIRVGKTPQCEPREALPLEVLSSVDPCGVRAGDVIPLAVQFMGQGVKAYYSASYWTWNEHGHPGIQQGQTAESGEFTVTFPHKGLWFLAVSYSLPIPGRWEATYALPPFFEKGASLPYVTTRYKTTLSIWVG